MTLYIDLYFIFNYIMDLLVILLCRRILGYRRSLGRAFLSALYGALYAVAVLSLAHPVFLPLHLILGGLMPLIACGFGTPKRFLRLLLYFYGISFFSGRCSHCHLPWNCRLLVRGQQETSDACTFTACRACGGHTLSFFRKRQSCLTGKARSERYAPLGAAQPSLSRICRHGKFVTRSHRKHACHSGKCVAFKKDLFPLQ